MRDQPVEIMLCLFLLGVLQVPRDMRKLYSHVSKVDDRHGPAKPLLECLLQVASNDVHYRAFLKKFGMKNGVLILGLLVLQY